jgi:hypothetical protein
VTPNDAQIDEIVGLEWEMFQDVNPGMPKVSCQNNFPLFKGMRTAQFQAWPEEALISYLDDLHTAYDSGRNLLKEKYLFMMMDSDPAFLARYADILPQPDEETQALASSIMETLLDQTAALHSTYPSVSDAGRPLYSAEDYAGFTSVETYQRGELLTYSKRTLKTLLAHIEALTSKGESYARDVLSNTVRFYGFATLEEAEAAAENQQAMRMGAEGPSGYQLDLAGV